MGCCGSFVPPAPIRDLRDLTRYRKAVIQDRTRVANRLHKALEEAGIKLAAVASDILGVSGRAMLAALVQGTTDPAVLADLARGRLRGKLPALRQALANRFRPHHAFVLGQLLTHLDYLDEAIATLSTEIERVMAPLAEPLRRLDTIPGINQRTAEVILAKIGPDMRVFPSARHLASWAALCPGHHERGGKHKSGKTRKGNRWLRTALIEAAAGASRAKHSALQARFRRVLRHRGPKKPSWQWPTPCCAWSTTSSLTERSIAKPVPTPTTVTIASASPGGPSRRFPVQYARVRARGAP